MYRTALETLHRWKAKKNRKPLIIRGARQVGKTWLMKEFGKTAFAHTVYLNFDNNATLQSLFAADLDISRIITGLELYTNRKIDPASTLLIFDEIQESPQALAALKYFNENAPAYAIVCAGSLLGVALHHGTSFPVGKVEFHDLYPLSFIEFLRALGNDRYADLLLQGDFTLAATFQQHYTDLLRHYYYIGGMPEAVQAFADTRDFNEARAIQQRILTAYEQDFSKHAPSEIVPRIRMLWQSIPAQLAKENKKFIYGLLKEGARAKEYEHALLWLSDCGLIHKIHRATAPSIPIKAYEDPKSFKLFLLDVGLLACMTRLNQQTLIEGNALFTEFKGALTEQYTLQQLKTFPEIETAYWTSDSGNAEIDFLIDTGSAIIPLEVKAETNLRAKSLKTYRDKFSPPLSIRASMAGYKREPWLLNLPLWAIETLPQALDR